VWFLSCRVAVPKFFKYGGFIDLEYGLIFEQSNLLTC
jgi:hypothetical protein